MLDVVSIAMFIVVAVMCWSIFQVRYHKRYKLHKQTQLALAATLLLVVFAFEIEIRIYGWEDRAAGSIGGSPAPSVWTALYTHMVFAISSACLWPLVIYRASRQFPTQPVPSTHSRSHVFWARIAAADMFLTAITGWIFYYLAFV